MRTSGPLRPSARSRSPRPGKRCRADSTPPRRTRASRRGAWRIARAPGGSFRGGRASPRLCPQRRQRLRAVGDPSWTGPRTRRVRSRGLRQRAQPARTSRAPRTSPRSSDGRRPRPRAGPRAPNRSVARRGPDSLTVDLAPVAPRARRSQDLLQERGDLFGPLRFDPRRPAERSDRTSRRQRQDHQADGGRCRTVTRRNLRLRYPTVVPRARTGSRPRGTAEVLGELLDEAYRRPAPCGAPSGRVVEIARQSRASARSAGRAPFRRPRARSRRAAAAERIGMPEVSSGRERRRASTHPSRS